MNKKYIKETTPTDDLGRQTQRVVGTNTKFAFANSILPNHIFKINFLTYIGIHSNGGVL